MLFNSYEFIFLYLPITLLLFLWLGRIGHGYAKAWLAGASIFFYSWWNPIYLGLLLASICFNYIFSIWITSAHIKHRQDRKKTLLVIAIVANISALVYYKYTNFFVSNLAGWIGKNIVLDEIVLPLGISFFTFTQIAYLVDNYQGKVKEYNFVHYVLFVTYFPHLIAGPVLHHKEMMPQFGHDATYKINYANIATGISVFVMGLFKKVILADGVAAYVSPLFDGPTLELSMIEAWSGALAYSLQLYFDFSGYSDMAIGLSLLFGIKLPINFNSPYKSVNIIEFWRRWHMTLSRFLKDYLYIPLGGNRVGKIRRYFNLLLTMLLGGLWHGAGWNFLIWGGLHGLYLIVNHAWLGIINRIYKTESNESMIGNVLGTTITFLAVVIAWVFFRSPSLDKALSIITGMCGANGISLPEIWRGKLGNFGYWLITHHVKFTAMPSFAGLQEVYWITAGLIISWFLPNTQQVMDRFVISLDSVSSGAGKIYKLKWRPTVAWALILSVMASYSLLSLTKVSEFLYFQF